MKLIHKQGSTQMLFRVASGNFKPCYKKTGIDGKNAEDSYIEVTQDLYNKGVVCIPDARTPVEKDGMVKPTYLNVGDIILVKRNGVYKMTRQEIEAEYSI